MMKRIALTTGLTVHCTGKRMQIRNISDVWCFIYIASCEKNGSSPWVFIHPVRKTSIRSQVHVAVDGVDKDGQSCQAA